LTGWAVYRQFVISRGAVIGLISAHQPKQAFNVCSKYVVNIVPQVLTA